MNQNYSILLELTKKQELTLAIEIAAICVPSVFLLIFTLYCYFKFEHLNNAQFKLVTRILFSDLIYESIMSVISLSYIITANGSDEQTSFRDSYPTFCYIEAYLSNFSILTSTAWTSIICHTLYMQVYRNISKMYYYQYIFVGYVIPTIISFIPFYVDGYGVTYPMESTNCFYNMRLERRSYDLYITLCYYLPIWVAFLYNLIIITLVVRRILKHITDFTNKTQVFALFLYPTILFICWVIVILLQLSCSLAQFNNLIHNLFYGNTYRSFSATYLVCWMLCVIALLRYLRRQGSMAANQNIRKIYLKVTLGPKLANNQPKQLIHKNCEYYLINNNKLLSVISFFSAFAIQYYKKRNKNISNIIELASIILRLDDMGQLLYKENYHKWIKVQELIAKDPILQNNVADYGQSRDKLFEIYCKKAYKLHKLLNYSDEMIPETVVTVLHQTMFIPTIKYLGTEKQIEKWVPPSQNYEIVGCYAQTELGHGSDVQSLETTAVYDKNTEEFILNSPTISSTKWWIGDLGLTATHAVTHAQLFINGKHYGSETHILIYHSKGIEVGDVGPKYGYNTKDNGYLRMNNVRIPREQMLMRYSKVSKAGEFIKAQNEKIGYATMMQVRTSIIHNTYVSLAQGLAIGVKYSHFRRQFKDKNGIERPIIDYQTQQDKLIPLIADCYAQGFGCLRIREILTENLKRITEKNDFSLMGDLHALLCCCKAVYTWNTHFGLDKIRQSLGGHGFLQSSGVVSIQTEFAPSCTYEGENTVLLLQTGRYLLKACNKAQKHQPINENVEYLYNIQQTLSQKATFTKS
ncbi:unnamed protein product (macronuclear) [Paramecium tetraurelia]|uniref:acyl-CoA oxidase n=1 Tax=Paramecium tetraurelia TaxID=5888 RepID=A0DA51_PARTE|nr:uncharacterized protein GSPATT00039368001 [Paramecium tetraurelia]CAK79918.1 unnamed protein product [Paramecium tetraurelia]|eukprot:XP_001447315.1 hypothetical protein (macronuclear) [Paramecium tetraurelia strain d4-2]